MKVLSDNYLIEISSQLAFLSTFLGGFAATFLVTLLVVNSHKTITNWVVSAAAFSACSFVVASVSFVAIGIALHPNAPSSSFGVDSINSARAVSFVGFSLGIIMLLTSVGLSGWIRSKIVGIATSSFAIIAIIIIFWAISGFK